MNMFMYMNMCVFTDSSVVELSRLKAHQYTQQKKCWKLVTLVAAPGISEKLEAKNLSVEHLEKNISLLCF